MSGIDENINRLIGGFVKVNTYLFSIENDK